MYSQPVVIMENKLSCVVSIGSVHLYDNGQIGGNLVDDSFECNFINENC